MRTRSLAFAILAGACAPPAEPATPAEPTTSEGSGTGAPSSSTGSADDSTAEPEDAPTGDLRPGMSCTVATDCVELFGFPQECQPFTCREGHCLLSSDADGQYCQYGTDTEGICSNGVCLFPECWQHADCWWDSCTLGLCGPDRQCWFDSRVPDGEPAVPRAQREGDCAGLVCHDGLEQTEDDPDDPEDDGNPCTVDICEDGQTVHLTVPEGTPCGPAGATCTAEGDCMLPGG